MALEYACRMADSWIATAIRRHCPCCQEDSGNWRRMQFDSLPADDPDVVRERELCEQDRLRRLEYDRQQLERQQATGPTADEQDYVTGQRPDEPLSRCCFSQNMLDEFKQHSERLRQRSRQRRQAMTLKSAVLDREEREQTSAEDMLGRRQPQDEFQGDVNLRTLQQLLKMIDERGFERSPHQVRRLIHHATLLPCLTCAVRFVQLKFHSAFERATARVVYRDVRPRTSQPPVPCTDVPVRPQDWGTQRPAIMKKNNWTTCPSEVLIRYAPIPPRTSLCRHCLPILFVAQYTASFWQGQSIEAVLSSHPHYCMTTLPTHCLVLCRQTFSIGIFAACLALSMKCEVSRLKPCSPHSPMLHEYLC